MSAKFYIEQESDVRQSPHATYADLEGRDEWCKLSLRQRMNDPQRL